MQKIESTAFRFAWEILDWIYPPECAGCGKLGYRWCEECAREVVPLMEPICEICGQSLTADQSKKTPLCPGCRKEKPHFTALRAFGVFAGTLRNALHSLKYKDNLGLGDVLSRYLLESFRKTTWRVELVVPVPLSLRRMMERGYNQAAYLARPLAWDSGLRYDPQAVSRLRDTASQVGLNLADRKRNMQDAFSAQPARAGGKRILLVDDVATTGATLNACSKALLDAGAEAVFGLTLARAQYGT